ncbi:MAG: hypothetical protein G01um101444_430 [Parcubacteria group bacterium Gr01-1014_44]|nr:MAG: hypothetical protein G01um101444_430 [Parcubacteria group bacterium Gr01-1014_44]
MAYVLNLVSSLAKREYYAENGEVEEDPRKAFDHTLKKLNDVLEDFFENKEFQLNLGLLAIAGENIHIAKLGKLKIFLARSGEIIDILNNVDLFQREVTAEKKFSNVVSGKIQEDDKLFALYPTRQLTAKEKSLKLSLVQNDQEKFLANLASIGQSAKNFSCCGFHIEIKKIKETEIPVRSAYAIPVAKLTAVEEPPPKTKKDLVSSADVSVVKRENIFEKIWRRLAPRRHLRRMPTGHSWKTITVVIVILLSGFLGVKSFFLKNNPESSAIDTAQDNIKLAEIKITQNEPDSARELLGLSLSSLSILGEGSKKIDEIKGKINSLLDRLDLVSAKQPVIFSSFSDANAVVNKVLISESGELLAVNPNKKVFKITGESQTETSPLPELISTAPAKDAAIYAGNLYVLEGRAIYKYSDAMTGGISKQLWLGGLTDSDPQNIAVDGLVYILSSDGTVVKYFKGKEESRINLNTKISLASKLIIGKDAPYLYVADFSNKKIRVFDKITGSLVMTYKTTSLEKFTDLALGDKILYLTSGDNKVWKLDLN